MLSGSKFTLLQMSVQARSPAQLQWSQPVLSSMQQSSQNVAQLELCSLSAIAMSGSRHNVAVIASTPGNKVVLQLLSVSAKSRAEEFSTHLLQLSSDTDGKLSQRGGKWRCCCGQYNEVLIWQQGGSSYKWTLQTGMLAQQYWRTTSSCEHHLLAHLPYHVSTEFSTLLGAVFFPHHRMRRIA